VDPRLLPWKRGNSEGNGSLLSRAEAQYHLYVTAILISCFNCPVTCNREENSFSSKKFSKKIQISIKKNMLPSPATAPKFD